MGAITAAIGDLILTFMWIFCSSTFGLLTSLIVTALDLQTNPWAAIFVTMVIIFVFVLVFTVIGDALGGASFNPSGNASFYAARMGCDTLIFMALRFPAQTAGAVGGALAIKEVMLVQYKHMIGGPSLKVDIQTGSIAEGVLTFVISFLVLCILVKGPRSSILKAWMLAMEILVHTVTVPMILARAGYTGPSMNPANAFGWAYVGKWHNTWEQFYVYWICPFIGATLAGWTFRAVFPPATPAPKQKKALVGGRNY